MTKILPTIEAYAELQQAYEHFNAALFEGKLPFCLITFQREKRTYGYFSHQRFVRRSGEQTDEIAMNPCYFSVCPIEEVMSTLVHEMAHLWQYHFGTPGRRAYHNAQWADFMEAIGLMPSDTGQPGGRRVGEHMADYIIAGGRFENACRQLLATQFTVSWLDRFPPERPRTQNLSYTPTQSARPEQDRADLEELSPDYVERPGFANIEDLVVMPPEEPVNRSNRLKFRCPNCEAQAWGKPGLKLLCGEPECEGRSLTIVG